MKDFAGALYYKSYITALLLWVYWWIPLAAAVIASFSYRFMEHTKEFKRPARNALGIWLALMLLGIGWLWIVV